MKIQIEKTTLEQALEALKAMQSYAAAERKGLRICDEAIASIKAALAQPAQEPVVWQTMEAKYPSLEKLDIRMGDGSILCNVWPQSDGDLWWEGSGTGEKFIDPKYANVTHWQIHSDTTPPQPVPRQPLTDIQLADCIPDGCEIIERNGERNLVAMTRAQLHEFVKAAVNIGAKP